MKAGIVALILRIDGTVQTIMHKFKCTFTAIKHRCENNFIMHTNIDPPYIDVPYHRDRGWPGISAQSPHFEKKSQHTYFLSCL